MKRYVLPYPFDFIGIGAPKSGTTWLARQLKNHPQIAISGERNYLSLASRLAASPEVIFQYFTRAKNEEGKLCGTYHNSYLYSPDVLWILSRQLPRVKLYVILRNPIDRAVSEYLHSIVWDQEIGIEISFEKALKSEPIKQKIIDRGFYDYYLCKWLECFDRSRILILLYEDIKNDKSRVLEGISRFLDIDNCFQKEMAERKINFNPIQRVIIEPETLELLEEIYAPTREYIEGLLNRDLMEIWNKDIKRASYKSDVNEINVLIARGLIHYDNGNYEEALKIFTSLYNRRIKNRYVYETLTELLKMLNRYEEANLVEATGKQVVGK